MELSDGRALMMMMMMNEKYYVDALQTLTSTIINVFISQLISQL